MSTAWPLPVAFEHVRDLGTGAGSTVCEAVQLSTGRSVAVKVLTSAVTDATTRRRFERECASMAALAAHPHIVTILDAGIHEGRPWIAMELCRRGSLGTAEPMDVHVVLDMLVATARAMDAAHGLGVLHCDLKPANILTTDFGSFAVADFGIARTASSVTTTGGSGYSLDYAAPEVLDGHPPTTATDVYCLGATAWALLSGRRPFRDAPDTPTSAVVKRILFEPLPPAPLRAPAQLTTLIADMTRKKPAERVGSMAEVARRAQAIRDRIGTPAAPPPAGAPVRPVVPPVRRDEPDPGDDTVYRAPRTGPGGGSPSDGAGSAPPPARAERPTHVLLALTGIILIGLLVAGAVAAVHGASARTTGARGTTVAPPATASSLTAAPSVVAPSTAPSGASPSIIAPDLGLPVSERDLDCSGAYIVIIGSAVTPGRYQNDVAALLKAAPGSHYLLTAHSCASLADHTVSGDLIYAVYLGPFPGLHDACSARSRAGAIVRQLVSTPPTAFPHCQVPG